MGDIYKKVKVCALDPRTGKAGPCKTVTALLDSGSTRTVVSANLARDIGAKVESARWSRLDSEGGVVEGVAGATVAVQVQGRDCEFFGQPVVVSDELALKAAPKGEMILGTDHMQSARLRLMLSTLRDRAVCPPAKKKQRRG